MAISRILTAEHLELGGGLEVLLAAALEDVSPGGRSRSGRRRAPSRSSFTAGRGWQVTNPPGRSSGAGNWTVVIRRGPTTRVLASPLPPREVPPPLRTGGDHTGDWRDAPAPAAPELGAGLRAARSRARALCAFASLAAERPRSAVGRRRRRVGRAGVGATVGTPPRHSMGGRPGPSGRRGTRRRAGHDVPRPERVRRALRAGRVPCRRVNPQFVELLLWLSSHVHDEARHIEVFTKRALRAGMPGTRWRPPSCRSKPSWIRMTSPPPRLLLNVLGEGTFLDLLRCIERHAPDAATATAAHLAHRDERRHVHFGISKVNAPSRSTPPDGIARHRGGGTRVETDQPRRYVARAHRSPDDDGGAAIQVAESRRGSRGGRALTETIERNRLRRLSACGFDTAPHVTCPTSTPRTSCDPASSASGSRSRRPVPMCTAGVGRVGPTDPRI